jgi:5'-nucleotidase
MPSAEPVPPPPLPPAHDPALTRLLTILHFNDVYDVAMASRFVHVVKSFASDDPLVLFSGDCYSPSLMSVVTKGAQMPPVLNAAGVSAAVFGNHEFDFGVEQCHALCGECDFPWLMSNCDWRDTGTPLGGGERSVLLEHGGLTIGLMGLIEREWLATLSTISEDELCWRDDVDVARELAAELRARGADVVIALTHMRLPNDERLAAAVPELDCILGGHDHDYGCYPTAEAPRIIKSGSDFRELSRVTIELDLARSGEGRSVRVTRVEHIEVAKYGAADEATSALVSGFEAQVGRQMETKIGETMVPLDARFATIRSRESNVSNFVADVLREATGAQLALLNAGTLRADRVLGPGKLTMRDLVTLCPMADETVVIRVSGAQLLAALENGVSSYPKLEGRWPCVSGFRFAFDPSRPAGARVVPGSVHITSEALTLEGRTTAKGEGREGASEALNSASEALNSPEGVDSDRAAPVAAGWRTASAWAALLGADDAEAAKGEGGDGAEGADGARAEGGAEGGAAAPDIPLDLNASYTLVTKQYLTAGKDGYTCFVGAPVVTDAEQSPLLPNLLQNHFRELAFATGASTMSVLSPARRQQVRSIARVASTPAKTPHELSTSAGRSPLHPTADGANAPAKGAYTAAGLPPKSPVENKPPRKPIAAPHHVLASTPVAVKRTPHDHDTQLGGAINPRVEGRIVQV